MMIHVIGGDAMGMTKMQEEIHVKHLCIDVFAMRVNTDIVSREDENVITHEEVLEAAAAAEPKFSSLFRELILMQS